ncbi:MAG: XdhC family protein [Ectothiorhodospiraceae bacterium]|jgi:xanthine dehydrogenase accessory factor
MAKQLLDVLLRLRDERSPHAVATVVETQGSVSAKTGSKAVIGADGRLLAGWVGGGCAESTASQTALDCIKSGEPRIIDIDMTDEMLGVGMPCGGSMRVYVEPVLPRPVLWILGHGRVAEAVCAMGDLVGFDVVVNDPLVRNEDYPAARELISDDIDYSRLQPGPDDFVVVATQHKGDHESMQRTLASDARYVALIASRKRAGLVLDFLREKGYAENDIARVRTPAGLDLNARTPEEIALSVVSEIVMERRGGSGQPIARMEKLSARATAPALGAGGRT